MLLLNLYLHLYLLSAPNELKWRFSMLHGKFSKMVTAQMSFPETKSSKFWKLEFPEWVITSWWPQSSLLGHLSDRSWDWRNRECCVVAGITGMKHCGVGLVFVAGGGQLAYTSWPRSLSIQVCGTSHPAYAPIRHHTGGKYFVFCG